MDPNYPCDVDGHRCISTAKRSDNRAAGVAIHVKREVQADAVSLVQQVYDCGEVCAVRLGSVVIACVYIAPGTCVTRAADLVMRELLLCMESFCRRFQPKCSGLQKISGHPTNVGWFGDGNSIKCHFNKPEHLHRFSISFSRHH